MAERTGVIAQLRHDDDVREEVAEMMVGSVPRLTP